MRHFILILFLFCACKTSFAQSGLARKVNDIPVDTVRKVDLYFERMQELVVQRDSLDSLMQMMPPNAYYFQVLSTPTLYKNPIHQLLAQSDSSIVDRQIQSLYSINKSLASLYVAHPELVLQTEQELKDNGAFREDIQEKIVVTDKLSEKVQVSNFVPELDEKIEVITRRPNFWKFSGNSSLTFTQNYFSENWYQGGESNYAGQTTLTLNGNFNNQKKITWNNQLVVQLGFQTASSDKFRTFRPTSNKLRYLTNFGYKAYKKISYSGQVEMTTQIVTNYDANSDNITTEFLAPLDVTIAPGMRYDIAWGKKKRFTGFLNLAPLAYNLRYVRNEKLFGRYGLTNDSHCRHNFGPNVRLNTTYKINNQINWSSSIYWFSDYSFSRIEWENTINFAVTKLITTQLYLYPRFDDSSKKKSSDGEVRYFMFKEFLSLGLNYSF